MRYGFVHIEKDDLAYILSSLHFTNKMLCEKPVKKRSSSDIENIEKVTRIYDELIKQYANNFNEH